jgi:hypothetical protein
MFLFNKNRTKKKTARATSSRVWRELHFSLLSPVLTNSGIDQEDIKEIWLLTFSVLNKKMKVEIGRIIEDLNWKELSKILGQLPIDYDETDYDTIQVLYIALNSRHLVFVVTVDKDYQKMEYVKTKALEHFDLELFETRSLIYPV